MAVFIRIFLIGLVVYLALRIIASFGAKTAPRREESGKGKRKNKEGRSGIPEEIGDYVDYEEIDDTP
jgi:hypothetical protein